MAPGDSGVPADAPDQSSRETTLTSWKEIATFFGRDVRTVIRWEKDLGLPVRRDLRYGRGSVFAYQSELEAWRRAREAAPSRRSRWSRPWGLAVAVGVAAAGIGLLDMMRRRPAASATRPLVARPLTTYPGHETHAAFSPDGSRILFSWNMDGPADFDLFVLEPDQREPRRLTDSAFRDYGAAWASTGRDIAFLREESFRGPSRLLVRSLDTGVERELLRTQLVVEGDHGPPLDWSSDGQYLFASVADEPDAPSRVERIDVRTAERVLMTDPPAGSRGDSGPALSADGQQLAFARFRSLQVADLYVQALGPDLLPRGVPRRVTSSNDWASSPRWMPDSRTLVYASGRLESTAVWTVDVFDGQPPTRLPMLQEEVLLPALSRDGRRLVFSRGVRDHNIWAVPLGKDRAALGPPTQLVVSTRLESNPHVSPDGRWMAFDSSRSGTIEVWVARADGTEPRPVTKFGGPVTGSPRWSPDGTRLLFDSRVHGNADVFMVATPGGEPVRLTDSESDELVPTWSNDGRAIYFSSKRTGTLQVWKRSLSDGSSQQVTASGGLNAVESHDGRWLYFARAEYPSSLWRMPIGGGPEELVLKSLYWYNTWHLGASGIYFIPFAEPGGGSVAKYYDLKTGTSTEILPIPQPVRLGLAVSPDERRLLFVRSDRSDSDLLIIDGLR